MLIDFNPLRFTTIFKLLIRCYQRERFTPV